MIGQSFAPMGDPTQRPQADAGGQGPQEAIKILNLRMPKVAGAGAPAPQQLLNGMGSAGLPQQNANNPMIEAILRAVLGHLSPQMQAAPSAMGGGVPGGMPGGMPGPQGPAPKLPMPGVHYQPLPGGTAGPNPSMRSPQEHMPTGKMNGFDYKR
jgi:hypothetical protein